MTAMRYRGLLAVSRLRYDRVACLLILPAVPNTLFNIIYIMRIVIDCDAGKVLHCRCR